MGTRTIAFEYDPQHRLTKKTDARNKVFRYQYDFAGRFEQVTLPTGEVRKLSPSQRLAVRISRQAKAGDQSRPVKYVARRSCDVYRCAKSHHPVDVNVLGRAWDAELRKWPTGR
jgi:YD repeat-containing protein